MAAPKGNKFYLLRNLDGREPIFKTAKALAKEAYKYFEWCENNPLKEQQIVKYRDSHDKDTVDKKRPYTIHGLCIFLGISLQTFNNYEKREGFVEVTTRIKNYIYNQKFEGAAAGFFNPNIIARDLGLAEKSEVKEKKEELSEEELTSLIEEIREDLKEELRNERKS